jgi:hypothetical protein
MVEPRHPKGRKRIVKRAKSAAAEADLKEFDQLLSEESFVDPSAKLSRAQEKARSARMRRLKVLNRRLLKNPR